MRRAWSFVVVIVAVLAACGPKPPPPPAELEIIATTPPPATVKNNYSHVVRAAGGVEPYTWTLPSKDALLSWLTINSASGLLNGTPQVATGGAKSLTVQVTDAAGSEVQASFTLSVNECQEGQSYPCSYVADGACFKGSQTCAAGKLGVCGASAASTDLAACGAACDACGISGDQCVAGKCQCGVNAGCGGTLDTCCNNTGSPKCVDVDSDVQFCGDCDTVCDPAGANATSVCRNGACEYDCAPGWTHCPTEPITQCGTDLNNDEANCGECGKVCDPQNATGVCTAGGCQIASCDPGYDDCNGDPADGCETSLTSLTNCGQCGQLCSLTANASTMSCSTGTCEVSSCSAGYSDCDADFSNGCEVHTASDVTRCGSCTNVCNLPNANDACVNGQCAIGSCPAGRADCNGIASDGCETTTGTDTNCSGCGDNCGSTAYCDSVRDICVTDGCFYCGNEPFECCSPGFCSAGRCQG